MEKNSKKIKIFLINKLILINIWATKFIKKETSQLICKIYK